MESVIYVVLLHGFIIDQAKGLLKELAGRFGKIKIWNGRIDVGRDRSRQQRR